MNDEIVEVGGGSSEPVTKFLSEDDLVLWNRREDELGLSLTDTLVEVALEWLEHRAAGGLLKPFLSAHDMTWPDLNMMFVGDLAPLYELTERMGDYTRIAYAEDELHRRAVDGYEKPVFQGGYEVGRIRQFSDSLLALLLKANKPDKYADRQQVEHKGVMLHLHLKGVRD